MGTLLRLLAAALALPFYWFASWLLTLRGRRARVILTHRLHGSAREGVSAGQRFGRPGAPLIEELEMLRLAGQDASVRALALRIGSLALGWAQLDELRSELLALRQRGRKVHAYLDRPGHGELYLASACDSITVAPMAPVELLGLRAEVSFFSGALHKAEVTPHFESAGDYKAYGETFTRSSMSEEAREALDAVMGGIHRGLVRALAEGRGLTPEAVQALVDGGPHSAEEAMTAGLVDAIRYPDAWRRELRRGLGDVVPEPGEADALSSGSAPGTKGLRHRYRPLRGWTRLPSRRARLWERVARRKGVAVFALEGSIADGDEPYESPGRITPRPTIATLQALRKDDRVGAVVLRINSPGGSALASDMMWKELRRLADKKPLVASMGSVAASGGYYLAMAGHEVLADPLTITGSIGVVAGKFDVSGLLARLGVTRDVLSYGAHTGINSMTAGLTDGERARLRTQIEGFYAAFVGKAAACRGVEYDELERHAQGRIWTGEQAAERGLVDGLGGVMDAIRRAGVRGKLGADPPVWLAEPPRPGLMERLGRLPVGFGARVELPAALSELLGVELPALETPVQARLPFGLRIY